MADIAPTIDGEQHKNPRTILIETCAGRRNDPTEVLEKDPGYIAITEAMERSAASGAPIPIRTAISPVTSRWLLAGNEGNRTFSETSAMKYSKDMSAGRWPENGDGFSIAKTGELNNGQHRLVAIIHSGVTIMTNVTVGLSRASRSTNDIGLGRTLANVLTMEGVDNASAAAASTRLIIGWEESNSTAIRPARETTNLQVQERIETDPAIMESVRYSVSTKRARGILSPSQVGFIHYVLSKKSPDALRFMNALMTGADGERGLDVTDVRYIARERLNKDSRILKAQERIEIVFRAWNLWRKGETVTKFMITGRTPAPIA